ncbi:MAG TPA: phosphatidylglycerophosphatase A [Desulfatiglandales bacterium]|nr:phosphatidylglycerophosphatase A [Desulfatiglandales bacterium]
MNFKEKVVMFIATGCFIGKIPFAPGTFGSLSGILLCFILSKTSVPVALLCIIIFIIFSIWIANDAEKILKRKDPGSIVIDEIAGMAVTLIGLPFNVFYVASGFIIFRVLDITKPFPIRYIEKRISGGAGIVLDDIAAGMIANVILRIILMLS